MTASVQDGAFAWLVCAASFLNITILGGFFLTSGMLYIMFKDALDATDSQVSLIPALNIGLMHLTCPFAGMLSEKYGTRCISMVGSLLSTVGVACGAFSTQIYHLYIAYGLIGGIGLGMVFNASVSILDPYFRKYKRTACSLVFTGFGVGSIIFPPIINFLEDIYGWRGAMLLLAGINIHMMLTSALFRPFHTDTHRVCKGIVKEHEDLDVNIRLPIKQRAQHEIIRVLLLFKITPFLCINALALVYVLSFMIFITHLGSYILTLGYSNEDVVRIYMVAGISTTIARPLTGIIAQITNANIAAFIMVTLLLNGILTMTVPFMNQLWMLYMYTGLYQTLMTPSHILGSVTVMENVPKSQVSVALGVYMAFGVPGFILGAPVAVWLYDYTGVYAHSFILAGGIGILAALTMAPAAYHIHRKRRQNHSI